MKDLNQTFVDIDELAKKIEARIKELEDEEKKEAAKKEYINDDLAEKMSDLDSVIKEIDQRISELEEEEKVDIDELTRKVNARLASLDDVDIENDLEKTRYDLSEISKQINATIRALEKKKKDKKRKKAMYCDMARKNNKCKNKSCKNKKEV